MIRLGLVIILLLLLRGLLCAQQDNVLIYPKSNQVLSDSIVEFKWNTFHSATNYTLYISENLEFSNYDTYDCGILTSHNLELTTNQKYYWKVKTDIETWSNVDSLIIFEPQKERLSLFYTFDSIEIVSDTLISKVYDKSGNQNNASQGNVTKSGQFKNEVEKLNNLPAIYLDGADDHLLMDSSVTVGTAFILANWGVDDSFFPNPAGLVTKQSYSTGNDMLFVAHVGTSKLLDSRYFQDSIYINNTKTVEFSPLNNYKIIYGNKGNSLFESLVLGSNCLISGRYWNGDIAEVIIYDSNISDSLIQLTYSYIADKYNPPVNLEEDIQVNYGFADTSIITAYKPWFTSYSWSTGSLDSIISVSLPGTYSVTVSNIFDVESSDIISVSYPEVETINDATFCLFDTLIWNTGLNNDYSFLLNDFKQVSSTILLTEPGEYYVKVTDTLGNFRYSDTITISVDSFPYYATLGPDTTFCAGNTISLVSGYETAVDYLWNTDSTDASIPVYADGEYSVIATNENGCQAYDTILVTIQGVAPETNFSFDSVCLGDSTHFIDLSSVEEPDVLEQWAWKWNDDTLSNNQNLNYRFDTAGIYSISLVTSSDAGCSSETNKDVIVYDTAKVWIALEFDNTSCIGQPVLFLDSLDTQETIAAYAWQFGDGNTSIEQNPYHIYENLGDFTASLEVTTQNGCPSIDTIPVHIVGEANIPGSFSLISPKNNSQIADEQASFAWTKSNHTFFYRFQLATDSLFSNIIVDQDSIFELFFDATISINDNYFWRIIAYNICMDTVISSFSQFFKFSPSIDNTSLWYKMDSLNIENDSIVNGLFDCSGNSNNAYQDIVGKKPYLINNVSILNNKPSICFDGFDDHLLMDSILKIGTTFILANWGIDDSFFPNPAGLVTKQSYSTVDDMLFVANSGTTKLLDSRYFGDSIFINNVKTFDFAPLNNYKIIYGNKDDKLFENLVFGSNCLIDNRYWNGSVAEIIIYDSIISDSLIELTYSYLINKYNPPINLGQNIAVNYGFADTLITSAYKEWFSTYSWSTGQTDSVISVSQPGTYAVTVTDIFGFESSDSIQVFYPEIVSLSDTTICYGDTLTWNTKLKGPYSFEWNALSSDSAAAFITSPGEYFVKVTDTLGYFKYSDTIAVSVDSFPYHATLGPDTNLCVGNELFLLDYADQAKAYLWQDGSTFSTFEIQEAGTYWVRVEDTLGCVKYDSITVGINGIAPVPGFYYYQYCVEENIVFHDTSKTLDESEITAHKWYVNNTFVSEETAFNYTFNTTGANLVKLEVVASNSCADFIEKEILVQPLPTVNFSPVQGCTFVPVHFQSHAEVDGSYITNNTWTFHNDSSITSDMMNYTYNEPGNYAVQLVSESAYGCKDTLTQIIEIKPGPRADFSVSPACFGEPVFFQNNTEVFLGFPISYSWNLGNDSVSNDQNPTHLYDSAGAYRVELFAYQPSNGCADSASQIVHVYSNPVAVFENQDACLNEPFTLTESSYSTDEEINMWRWSIDNDVQFEAQNPRLTYSDTGQFNVQLVVSSASGCTDTAQGFIQIHELPDVDFVVNPDEGIPPFTPDFINNSTRASLFTWYFGDGETSPETEPLHTYSDSGSFVVSLVGITAFGCRDSLSKNIRVVIPNYDVGVLNVEAEIIDGFLNVSAQLVNYGSYLLDSIVLHITGEGGIQLRETWTGTLNSGEVVEYPFLSSVSVLENKTPSYVCVEALLPASKTDENETNNENCFTFDDAYKLIDPFPNPSSDQVIVGFNLPFEEEVTIFLYNSYGSKMQIAFDGLAKKGYNRVIIDVSKLDPGIYTYQLIVGEKIFSKRIMKSY